MKSFKLLGLSFLTLLAVACSQSFEANKSSLTGKEVIYTVDGKRVELVKAIQSKLSHFETVVAGFNVRSNSDAGVKNLQNALLGVDVQMGPEQTNQANSLSITEILAGSCASQRRETLNMKDSWNDVLNGKVVSLGNYSSNISLHFACLGEIVKGEPCSAAVMLVRSVGPDGYQAVLLKRNIGKPSFTPVSIKIENMSYIPSIAEKVKLCAGSMSVDNNGTPQNLGGEDPSIFAPPGTEDQQVPPVGNGNGNDQAVSPF